MTSNGAPQGSAVKSVEVEPLTIRTGAVIRGVDLSEELSDDVIAAIRGALLRHRVIFFQARSSSR